MKLNFFLIAFVLMGISLIAINSGIATSTFTPIHRIVDDNAEQQLFMSQLLQLIHDQRFQEELELTEKQLRDLRPIAIAYQKSMRSFLGKIDKKVTDAQTLIEQGNIEEGKAIVDALYEPQFEKMSGLVRETKSILLKHQINRLNQITLQRNAKLTSKFGEFGIPLALADLVGLSKAQKEKLKASTQQAILDFEEQVMELKKEAKKKILKSLPLEKRKEMENLIGEDFDDRIRSLKKSKKSEKE